MGYPSRKKEEEDYARNAIASGKDGNKKASAFDKMKLTELSAGEGMSMHGKTHGGPNMESAAQERSDLNKMPGGYKVMGDNGAKMYKDSPMQMKGSWMSKHTKSRM